MIVGGDCRYNSAILRRAAVLRLLMQLNPECGPWNGMQFELWV